MIDTFVIFRVLPDKAGQFESIHRTVLAHVGAMPGCLDVEVHRSATEPIEYMVH